MDRGEQLKRQWLLLERVRSRYSSGRTLALACDGFLIMVPGSAHHSCPDHEGALSRTTLGALLMSPSLDCRPTRTSRMPCYAALREYDFNSPPRNSSQTTRLPYRSGDCFAPAGHRPGIRLPMPW